MATRSEAKKALWEASAKDDAAREFIATLIAEHSIDKPRGEVSDMTVSSGVEQLKKKAKAKATKDAKAEKVSE